MSIILIAAVFQTVLICEQTLMFTYELNSPCGVNIISKTSSRISFFNNSHAGPSFVTVQEGFTVPDAALLPDTQAALQEYLADTVALATSMGVGTHELTVESGALEGIVAQVTITEPNATGNYEASTYLPGGMWLVKGMWTQSGVTNPLATFQNWFVFTCWLLVFVSVAVLLPPARTMRSAVWRGMIPAALKDAAAMLREHVENVTKEDGCNEKDEDANNNMKIAQLQGKCIYHMNALFDGTLAKYTVFEPRMLTNPCTHPPECTVYYLVQLSILALHHVSSVIKV